MTLNEKASSPRRGPPAEGICTLAALMAGDKPFLEGDSELSISVHHKQQTKQMKTPAVLRRLLL